MMFAVLLLMSPSGARPTGMEAGPLSYEICRWWQGDVGLGRIVIMHLTLLPTFAAWRYASSAASSSWAGSRAAGRGALGRWVQVLVVGSAGLGVI